MTREIEVSPSCTVEVEEQFELEHDGGAVVWDAALVLAHFLIYCQADVADPSQSLLGKCVLELGAGTGAVGLVAAALGASPVILTDRGHLVPHLDKNIRTNKLEASTSAVELEWSNVGHIAAALKAISKAKAAAAAPPTAADSEAAAAAAPSSSGSGSGTSPSRADRRAAEAMVARMHPDVIVGSDITYLNKELDSLFFTIGVLSGPDTTVFLSHEDREGASIPQIYDTAASNGFNIQKVPTGLLHPDWRSEDVHVYVLQKQPRKESA